MRVSVGLNTKRILLERNVYSLFVNEISKIQSSDNSLNKENLESVLRKYDPCLFNDYHVSYRKSVNKRVDLSFSLKKRDK